jgi:hypothetical protein
MNLSKIVERLEGLENSHLPKTPLDLIRKSLQGKRYEDLSPEDQERVRHYASLTNFTCGLDSMAAEVCREFLESEAPRS